MRKHVNKPYDARLDLIGEESESAKNEPIYDNPAPEVVKDTEEEPDYGPNRQLKFVPRPYG